MVLNNWVAIKCLLLVDAWFTPGMLLYRSIENARRKFNRSGKVNAGGKQLTFDEYKVKFARFHARFTYYKYGAAGLYVWGNMFLSRYTIGMNFAWGATNFSALAITLEFVITELVNSFLIPQGPACANNIRTAHMACGLFLLAFSTYEPYEVMLFARFARQVVSPLIRSRYSLVSQSPTKILLYDTYRNVQAAAFSHIPYLTDLIRLNGDNHEPYMCSLCLHNSMFKVLASASFAIYNNIDSPFKNSRALVALPWLLFDLPAVGLLMHGCTWDESLTYGVDRTPNLYRVVPISIAGAAYVWLIAMIPFMLYDLLKRLKLVRC